MGVGKTRGPLPDWQAGHAIVAVELGFGELVRVKIASYAIPGNDNQVVGATYAMPRHMRRTRAAYLDDIAVSLGGIAAETVVFDAFFDGAAGSHTADLNTVIRVATLLEAGLGMGHTLVVADDAVGRLEALRANDPGLRKRVHDVIANEFERAKDIIRNRRSALDEIATRLIQAKSLSGDDVRDIIERHRRPTVSVEMPRKRRSRERQGSRSIKSKPGAQQCTEDRSFGSGLDDIGFRPLGRRILVSRRRAQGERAKTALGAEAESQVANDSPVPPCR
ncbi:hypothetical protein E0H35_30450 [Rhizobium leguminosarum bv. viciae]|uniref:hypothetical protein n=1 Tax=Rhizobium leguminosarum TaxID=384 RepID=UPI001039FD95|nr:hypothetical protein [Rhizobium leguminosarum]MBY5340415.1 hypothetical protein [Rhizobium leguminosarum]NKK49315.1 hypothetical protein [Rhizobium leguminosarum bv. viciae]TBY90856.1 hypothetical protein E0H35_30450 [Rhizobium leguminosarum bv. viciae]